MNVKKKILFLIPNLKHGGAEKVLVNLANNLSPEKYDVTVQTLFDEGLHKLRHAFHVRYKTFFPRGFRGNSYLFKRFPPAFWWKLIVREHYDIAVSYLEGPTSRILAGCTDPNTKRIAWLHIELNTPKLAAQGFRSTKEAAGAYDSFDRVVAVSRDVRDCFLQNLPVSRPVDVLYNTNETGEIRRMSAFPTDHPRFITGDMPTVCSVAKLMKTKGFDRLLEAHRRLWMDGIRHRVCILGIGEEQAALEEQIRRHGLTDTFLLLGYKDNPYSYVAKSDLYVCSSRREGFSTAVTEALIVGTPVVSTDCSGARELLGDNNEYGLVVENSTDGIYEGMKKLLCDPALLTHYRTQAKLRGSYFSKEHTVQAVEEMFESL